MNVCNGNRNIPCFQFKDKKGNQEAKLDRPTQLWYA